jgi:hypothetical protein
MGGGANFQASVIAMAEVAMAAGAQLNWMTGIQHDVPIALRAETGGSGDDIALTFTDGIVAEVQVKKGLTNGARLWDSLDALARAVNADDKTLGVLVVCPNSSLTIRDHLARDIQRMGSGRFDDLKPISEQFLQRLTNLGLSGQKVSSRLRVVTVHGLLHDSADVSAAKSSLARLCTEPDSAWNALCLDAARLIELRGARGADSVVQVLKSEGLFLRTDGEAPSALLASLCDWTAQTTDSFAIPGIPKGLSLRDAWIELSVSVCSDEDRAERSALDALKRYHAFNDRRSSTRSTEFPAIALGRFVRRCVLVGGPGMGKSTLLRRLSLQYAIEGVPVLRFSAKPLIERMRRGDSFEESMIALASDGFGKPIPLATIRAASTCVVLCDALDEAGNDQSLVSEGLVRFAQGFKGARILVTTRPIGYDASHLSTWKHYELNALEASDVIASVVTLTRLVSDSDRSDEVVAFAKSQLAFNENARVAARSPLILGLITGLIVAGQNLGQTKDQLYDQLFRRMSRHHGGRTDSSGVAPVVLEEFLRVFARTMIDEPTLCVTIALDRCAQALAQSLNETKLQAAIIAHRCYLHWEQAGLLEKVNVAGLELATFVHKTFAEYATARYLAELSVEDARREIRTHLEDANWAEVRGFACSLGLLDLVIGCLMESADVASFGALDDVLALLVRCEHSLSPELRTVVFQAAERSVSSAIPREATISGGLLVKAGRRYPSEVASIGVRHAQSERPWTRLTAWACLTFSPEAPKHLPDLDALVDELPRLCSAVCASSMSRHGLDFAGIPGSQVDATYRYVVQTLLANSLHDTIGRFAPHLSSPHYMGSNSGINAIIALLITHGRQDLAAPLQAGRRFDRRLLHDTPRTRKGFRDPNEALFQAIRTFTPAAPSLGSSRTRGDVAWQLSGLRRGMTFEQRSTDDEWPKKIRPDDPVVHEVLKGCLAAGGFDFAELCREIDGIEDQTRRTKASGLSRLVYDHTESVDVEMDWTKGHVDLALLEAALHYPMDWLVICAAQLIEGHCAADDLRALVHRTFRDGKGSALWLGSLLCGTLPAEVSCELLLERLDRPLRPGCQHLYDCLASLNPPMSARLLKIIRKAVLGSGPLTATAATALAKPHVATNEKLAQLLQKAFDHWIATEDPMPVKSGPIPPSPREQILAALLVRDDFDQRRLLHYALDERSDVKSVATDALLRAVAAGLVMDDFLSAVAAGRLAPNLLVRSLKQGTPFTHANVRVILEMLYAPEMELRRAALNVLATDLVEAEDANRHTAALLNDPEQEIGERVRRIVNAKRKF